MARIVTVYNDWRQPFQPVEMGYIRWLKISEALARRGHHVDIATAETTWHRGWWRPRIAELRMNDHLRRVPLARVRWGDYDVVKTLFHVGFETLERHHGVGHPFVISKLGSVVGARDLEGVPFYGRHRERLHAIQERIHARSGYVTVISQPARALWEACHGAHNILVVPGAADREVPPPSADPFPPRAHPRCLFAGHVYFKHSQPEANAVLVAKLNHLGTLLSRHGIRLYVLGPGDVSKLDRRVVTYLGVCAHEQAWNYLQFADVGVVVAAAAFLHNNESTKIYHYLRVGLPVVAEAGFPNNHVIGEARLGFSVANGDLPALADAVAQATRVGWDREYAARYILEHHTWDQRVGVYDDLIARRSTP